MPQGLQVWDAGGNLIVDTSTYTIKTRLLIGEVSAAGSVSLTNLPTGSQIKVINQPIGDNYKAEVSVSGNTVSWDAGGANSFRSELHVLLV